MYQLFLSSTQPLTKLFSFHQFRKHQHGKIKDYILSLLATVPDGLSTRDISQISGIEIQSLTYPIKELEKKAQIKVTGIKKSIVSNRKVQVYSISQKAE